MLPGQIASLRDLADPLPVTQLSVLSVLPSFARENFRIDAGLANGIQLIIEAASLVFFTLIALVIVIKC